MQLIPEEYCPECKRKISWKTIHNNFGAPQANGLCMNCNVVFLNREAPDVTRGKNLEKTGITINLYCLDERITSLPCDVQIGIFRQRYFGY